MELSNEQHNEIFTCKLGRRLATGKCFNNHIYRYDGNDTQSYQWIRNDEMNRQDLCKIANVVVNCPQSCGYCCDDDTRFSYRKINNNGNDSCQWIHGNLNQRQHMYCIRKNLPMI